MYICNRPIEGQNLIAQCQQVVTVAIRVGVKLGQVLGISRNATDAVFATKARISLTPSAAEQQQQQEHCNEVEAEALYQVLPPHWLYERYNYT